MISWRGLVDQPARRVVSAARRFGPPVIWTPEGMNGGNYLYLWLTAWSRDQRDGRGWKVLHHPKMDPWLAEFPALRDLTVRVEEVSTLRPRTYEWGQQVGVDFMKYQIPRFVHGVLLKDSTFPERMARQQQRALVVNVRRGDYYADERFRPWYAMNIVGFVEAALQHVPEEEPEAVRLVSDDPQWCLEHLGRLEEIAPVSAMPGPHGKFEGLAQIAALPDDEYGNDVTR